MGKIIERVRKRQAFAIKARSFREQTEAIEALQVELKRRQDERCELDLIYVEACKKYGVDRVCRANDGTFSVLPKADEDPWWRFW